MANASKKLSDKIRAAILAAPVSRYRIAKDTGIFASVLSRFVNKKKGLDLSTADVLAEYLNLELVEVKKRTVKHGINRK